MTTYIIEIDSTLREDRLEKWIRELLIAPSFEISRFYFRVKEE